jgi:hypothetical protein
MSFWETPSREETLRKVRLMRVLWSVDLGHLTLWFPREADITLLAIAALHNEESAVDRPMHLKQARKMYPWLRGLGCA